MPSENIKVVVRIRPLIEREKAYADEHTPKDDSSAPHGHAWNATDSVIRQARESNGVGVKNETKWRFDHVFPHDTNSQKVYETMGKEMIADAMRGFNATIFAYGQTSSGKTHTMYGDDKSGNPGIVPNALRQIFRTIEESPDRQYLLRVSFLELYNENLADLLGDATQHLKLRENPKLGYYVEGLREEIVNSPDQVLEIMARGDAQRHTAATAMNKTSSRSHSIFRIVIESTAIGNDISIKAEDAVLVSTLNLVDLAGSERLAQTQATGDRMKEGVNINKSLLALGTVISKLSEGRKGAHIPFRDSKLTRLLQSSLGGNSRTCIVCAMTPAMQHIDESVSTLRFATRAKKIVNKAKINEVMDDQAMLKRLRREIEELKEELASRGSGSGAGGPGSPDHQALKEEAEQAKEQAEVAKEAKREMEDKLKRLSNSVLLSTLSKWKGFDLLTKEQREARAKKNAISFAKAWSLKARRNTLERAALKAKEEAGAAKKLAESHIESRDRAQSQVEELTIARDRATSQTNVLKTQVSELERALEDARAKIRSLESEVDSLRGEVTAAKEGEGRQRTEVLRLQQQMMSLGSSPGIDNLNASIGSVSSETYQTGDSTGSPHTPTGPAGGAAMRQLQDAILKISDIAAKLNSSGSSQVQAAS